MKWYDMLVKEWGPPRIAVPKSPDGDGFKGSDEDGRYYRWSYVWFRAIPGISDPRNHHIAIIHYYGRSYHPRWRVIIGSHTAKPTITWEGTKRPGEDAMASLLELAGFVDLNAIELTTIGVDPG